MSFEDGRLRVVQIACGPTSPAGDGHMLYALTEDGRVWSQWGGDWQEEAPILDRPTGWRRPRVHVPTEERSER